MRPTPAARKILFFPLSNVLGHLTRTLALAEEFEAQGHEVYLAASRTCSSIIKVLPATIRVLPTPEMYAAATRSFGRILHYREGAANDRANLECADRIDPSELRRRGRRLVQMVRRDKAIIAEVRPDAIITDYRFTAALIGLRPQQRLFHISHILGYPSYYRRVLGVHFFPLNSGHILVPGIRKIEYGSRRPECRTAERRESLCGMFRWRGWSRLLPRSPAPPPADVFLFFGSTGNGQQIVPWLLSHIPQNYRISGIAPRPIAGPQRRGAFIAQRGELASFLERSEVVFCHGGHGTVMECILERRPMCIFPYNIEQLEIGRRIEELGLGLLVKRPFDQLGSEDLGEIIEKVRSDGRIRSNLERCSELLRRRDGPRHAVATVLRSLANEAPAAETVTSEAGIEL